MHNLTEVKSSIFAGPANKNFFTQMKGEIEILTKDASQHDDSENMQPIAHDSFE